MDTLRLVKLAWDVRPPGADSCGGGVALDTNIRSMQKSGWSALSVVAGQMPQKCMSFDNMFSHHDRMWYEKAGVNPPRARAHSVCVVDQNALTHYHWEALRQLFPQCAGGGGATNAVAVRGRRCSSGGHWDALLRSKLRAEDCVEWDDNHRS